MTPVDVWQLDERPRLGAFPIEQAICWNGMTPDQQERVEDRGLIRIGDYGGGPCPERAEVEVLVRDTGNGPRFYCAQCATTTTPKS